MKIVCNHFGSQ